MPKEMHKRKDEDMEAFWAGLEVELFQTKPFAAIAAKQKTAPIPSGLRNPERAAETVSREPGWRLLHITGCAMPRPALAPTPAVPVMGNLRHPMREKPTVNCEPRWRLEHIARCAPPKPR